MFIQKLATMFRTIVFALLGWINLPTINDDFANTVNDFINGIIEVGSSLVLFFIHDWAIKSALAITIALAVFKYGYYLVMWIMKKIPVASVS